MSTHSYSLQWADHQTILTSAVLNCSPDVTLVCSDVHIPANRLVLSASSTLFYSLLKEAPLSPIMISLPDINHDHLNSLLTFLHTGQLKVTKDEFAQVHATALHLQMRCFSVEETGSGGNILPTFCKDDSLSYIESGQPYGLPEEKIVDMVSEDKYVKMRKELVDQRLKKASEEDGRTSWRCDICGEKWVGNVSKDKRKAVRHMELHLRVKVRCSLCGISSKSLNSLSAHKSTSCKAEPEKDTESIEVDVVVKNMDEDVVVAVNPDELSISSVKVPEAPGSPNTKNDLKKLETDMAKVDNDWYCLICGKFWPAKGKCKRHMQTHFPSKLACEICGKMFSSKYKLQNHVNSFHRESICISVKENKFQSHLKEDGIGQGKLFNDEKDGQATQDDEEDGQAKLINDEEVVQAKHDDEENDQAKLINGEEGVQAKYNDKEDGQAKLINDDVQAKHDDEEDGQAKLINGEEGVQAKYNVKEDGQAKLFNDEDGQVKTIIDESNNNRGCYDN